MNIFTKEELQLILEDIDDLRFSKFYRVDNVELRKKVQNMIDKYCEHEWEIIFCQYTLDKIYCHKCETDMGNLKERYPNE